MKLQRYLTETTDLILENGPEIWQKLKKECRPFLKEYKKTGLVGKKVIYRGDSVRDVNTKKYSGIREIIPRQNRRPKDMPPALHNKFDEDFNNRHGWYARSEGVFTVAKKNTAASYGKPYLFFPTGKYRYLWTPETEDLYSFADGENLLSYGDDTYDDYSGDYETEDNWNREYGEGSGGGHWEYKGEEVSDYRSDRDDVEDEMKEREGDEYEWGEVEWIPEETLDDYIIQKKEEDVDRQENEILDMVNSYTNKDLKAAIVSNHEIMFDVKSYYIVSEIYEDFLADMMLSGKYQMKLPFPPFGTTTKPKYWVYNKKGKVVYNEPLK
jgi:hypothetical protein